METQTPPTGLDSILELAGILAAAHPVALFVVLTIGWLAVSRHLSKYL